MPVKPKSPNILNNFPNMARKPIAKYLKLPPYYNLYKIIIKWLVFKCLIFKVRLKSPPRPKNKNKLDVALPMVGRNHHKHLWVQPS